ncbi:hypothetical protein HPULCUR_006132 [Helicostylum pulchrum]|uniref:AB hydrolase-1 domain-containing protein n=1 Tax=Helicostylum pulchrum TaxID=562976 RepID=A0ABP9Y179_9FUNG
MEASIWTLDYWAGISKQFGDKERSWGVHSEHEVKGASLCYEVKGEGPCIVFMGGGDGGYKPFQSLRDLLVKHFTVVLYSRRGYYKSKLTEPQDYTKRLDTDVEDLYAVIKNVTNKSFSIFTSSSSGIVALTYVDRYPNTVDKCFLHEPMVDLSALPNGEQVKSDHRKGMEIFERYGRDATLVYFGDLYLNKSDRYYMVDKQVNQVESGWDYHFEHEAHQYLFTKVDTDRVRKNKLVLFHGIESTESFIYRPGAAFSKALGMDIVPVPGEHIGFYTDYKMFAVEFIKVCKECRVINHSKI